MKKEAASSQLSAYSPVSTEANRASAEFNPACSSPGLATTDPGHVNQE
jgi:hypothetical protein